MIHITGNKNFGLAKELSDLYPEASFYSRSSGYDLTTDNDRQRFNECSKNAKIIILCSALWRFNQTILLDSVYKYHVEQKNSPLIICIGSTVDRVKKGGKAWLYSAEKKALRDYCNSLAINGVWSGGPKVTLISFGSLSNVQHKHPERNCLAIEDAATYIQWIIERPFGIHINEISIDPLQITK